MIFVLSACNPGGISSPTIVEPTPDHATVSSSHPTITWTEAIPTQTLTLEKTKTPTRTQTITPTVESDGVSSDVYTFSDFETRQISFSELPFIDYPTLEEDDLSISIQVDNSVMAKAIPVQKSEAHLRTTSAVFTFETRLDPNHFSYINNPETRPFKVVRAFRTKVDGRDLPGAIVLVKNSDNSITKLKVLFASDFAKPANVKFLNEQFNCGPATDWEPIVLSTGLSPAMMPMDLGSDQMNVTIGEFHATPAELEEIKKLMVDWQDSGIAPSELGKYVIGLLPVVWTP